MASRLPGSAFWRAAMRICDLDAASLEKRHEVFAARALLYAERMLQRYRREGCRGARLSGVCANRLLACTESALKELDEIKTLQNGDGHAAALPAWASLVGPYCRFERQALLAWPTSIRS